MKYQYTQHEKVSLQECRYCDCSSYRYSYGRNEPPVCASCDAEWDPITVVYTAEELGLWEPEWDTRDDPDYECY